MTWPAALARADRGTPASAATARKAARIVAYAGQGLDPEAESE